MQNTEDYSLTHIFYYNNWTFLPWKAIVFHLTVIHAITEVNRKGKEEGLHTLPSSSACRLKETACDKYSLCGSSGWGWTQRVTLTLKNFRFLMDCPLWLKIRDLWILTSFWIICYLQVPGQFIMNCRHLKVSLISWLDREVEKNCQDNKMQEQVLNSYWLLFLFRNCFFPQVILACPFYFLPL